MLLAGDIGGTKTLLGVFARAPERPILIDVAEFTTVEYESLAAMIADFLRANEYRIEQVEAAAFGVAGPVLSRTARLSNVPWDADANGVADRLGIRRVELLNDLTAMAFAVPVLEPGELEVLQQGVPSATGNAALIAAGTGLGEALLHRANGRLMPSPSEGGHADFAARTAREIELLTSLIADYGRVDWERVLSGPGLVNLYRFTHTQRCDVIPESAPAASLPALISSCAIDKRCQDCVEALDLFVSIYGAESGNLALRCVATAGVYVGGGIAPKILPALTSGRFLEAFRAKPPLEDLLSAVPVSVILNTQAGMLGAAVYANSLR